MLPAVPELPAGTVLELRTEDWRYGGHPLCLRVEEVRHDLSHYYREEWLWVIGEALDADGTPSGRMEALVKVAALAGPRTEAFAPHGD
ncbi:hypothetical protein [Plantactinospora sp. CA-290183]|uniref:hypothetical protein n=1 Tax=Plantactinospora sp. CA-290183 TaxID=3240006 RepID=UPI003D8D7DF4